MPKLKLYVFEYDGPDPSSMLKEALTMIFPDGMPAGATATAAEEIDEEAKEWHDLAAASRDTMDDDATDLEPLDEPTEISEEQPLSTPCATPELPAQELPAKPAGRRGPPKRHVPREVLEETIAALRACDDNRREAADKLGISKNAFLRRLELAKEAGIDVPAPVRGNPKHRAKR